MAVYTVAITGASGAAYGVRLLGCLLEGGHHVHLCVTREGGMVLREETGLSWSGTPEEMEVSIRKSLRGKGGSLRVFYEDDFLAPIASGSVPVDAMIIVPCSMKTAAGVAAGSSGNLVERAADVTLKERRPLIMVPRETPLSAIHLRNLLTLARMGVHVLPAMPAFYHHPKSVEEMVDFVVGRILDALKLEHRLYRRWTSAE